MAGDTSVSGAALGPGTKLHSCPWSRAAVTQQDANITASLRGWWWEQAHPSPAAVPCSQKGPERGCGLPALWGPASSRILSPGKRNTAPGGTQTSTARTKLVQPRGWVLALGLLAGRGPRGVQLEGPSGCCWRRGG